MRIIFIAKSFSVTSVFGLKHSHLVTSHTNVIKRMMNLCLPPTKNNHNYIYININKSIKAWLESKESFKKVEMKWKHKDFLKKLSTLQPLESNKQATLKHIVQNMFSTYFHHVGTVLLASKKW